VTVEHVSQLVNLLVDCTQCFKYQILAIYRSAKLYTEYYIPGDISRYSTKYRRDIG